MSNLLLTVGGMTFAWNGRGVGVNFDRTVDGFVADDRIKLLIILEFYVFYLISNHLPDFTTGFKISNFKFKITKNLKKITITKIKNDQNDQN